MSELTSPKTVDHQPKISITHVANLVGDAWTLRIISELMCGSRRFGQLQEGLSKHSSSRSTNISPKTLSQRLKFMESGGLITRQSYPEIPPRVEYNLTEKGYALLDIIKAMSDFETRYMSDFECHEGHPNCEPPDTE